MQLRTRIRYECTRCGSCCKWQGYVRVSTAEIERMAQHLGLTTEEFVDGYTRLGPDRRGLVLTDRADTACVFLTDDDRCTVNPVKPNQCAAFPNTWNFPGFQQRCQARAIQDWLLDPDDEETCP